MKPKTSNETGLSAFSKLQLFVPGFPGGFEELEHTMIRSLQFFWPSLDQLNITVVLDDTVYKTKDERQSMTHMVHSFFRPDVTVTVKYNPRSNRRLFRGGWNIQQLIMFWADNFTDAEYIGFLDDDTLFSKAVLPDDLFDEEGRPRVLALYPTASSFTELVYTWHQASFWALGHPSLVIAMSYFPIIVRRNHLREIREAMLRQHPEYPCFDDLFAAMIRKEFTFYSQFVIMFDYIWLHHRDEYDWHFARDGPGGEYLDGYPHDFDGHGSDKERGISSIATGSLDELGITADMRQPFPRATVHAGYVKGGRNRAYSVRQALVDEILALGYCFSQPLDVTLRDATFLNYCQHYYPDIETNINERCQWTFEFNTYWVPYDFEGVQLAHVERMQRNVPRLWDHDEVRTVLKVRKKNRNKQAQAQCKIQNLPISTWDFVDQG